MKNRALMKMLVLNGALVFLLFVAGLKADCGEGIFLFLLLLFFVLYGLLTTILLQD